MRKVCGEEIITINFYTLTYFNFFMGWCYRSVCVLSGSSSCHGDGEFQFVEFHKAVKH